MAQEKSRREFCVDTCRGLSVAAIGATFGSLLQGCDTFTYPTPVEAIPSVSGAEANGSVLVTVDATSPLAAVKGAAMVQTSAGPLLLLRTTPDSISALSGTCTHRVCTITGFVNETFVCPCHGSEFDTGGRVVSGPANSALHEYSTRFAHGVLNIQL